MTLDGILKGNEVRLCFGIDHMLSKYTIESLISNFLHRGSYVHFFFRYDSVGYSYWTILWV